jgi:CRISPR-associated protein Csd2
MSRPTFDNGDFLDKRYEFVFLFDVKNGNPNGDPDAGNAPRVDPETGHGLVTDVCIKRKIRNFVAQTRSFQPPDDIYVKEHSFLVEEHKKAYEANKMEAGDKRIDIARGWMCKNYFDVRAFGAVMTVGGGDTEEDEEKKQEKTRGKKTAKLLNCGQVRGPVQLAFARSIDPILSISHTITRVAKVSEKEAKGKVFETPNGELKPLHGEFAQKHGVPYGLYRMHGFISPFLASDTGFAKRDLGLLIEALQNLFTLDRSAARGEMEVRGLYLFEHSSKLGNAPAHKLFETINIPSVKTARAFADYNPLSAPEDGAEAVPGVTVWRYV